MQRASTKLLLTALALVASACVVAPTPPPPPPPQPRILPATRAVAIATQFARSRGLVIDYTVAARVDAGARWHVELGGAGGRDNAQVILDGFSGRVLHARLRGLRGQPQAAPPPSGVPPSGQAPPPAPGSSGGAPGAQPGPGEPPANGQPPAQGEPPAQGQPPAQGEKPAQVEPPAHGAPAPQPSSES